MEGDLSEYMKEELPFSDYIAIIQSMLEIVRYLRQIGLVHNDIKPENFLFDSSNNIDIADLNCAYLIDHPPKEICGTIGYYSPEYFCKDNSNQSFKQFCKQNNVIPLIDYNNDIWQVGVTSYQFLFRELPFGVQPNSKHFSDVVSGKYNGTSAYFEKNVRKSIERGEYTEEQIEAYVAIVKDFISRMLKPSRIERETPSSLLNHEVFEITRNTEMLG